jgi:hypothetical protein
MLEAGLIFVAARSFESVYSFATVHSKKIRIFLGLTELPL